MLGLQTRPGNSVCKKLLGDYSASQPGLGTKRIQDLMKGALPRNMWELDQRKRTDVRDGKEASWKPKKHGMELYSFIEEVL